MATGGSDWPHADCRWIGRFAFVFGVVQLTFRRCHFPPCNASGGMEPSLELDKSALPLRKLAVLQRKDPLIATTVAQASHVSVHEYKALGADPSSMEWVSKRCLLFHECAC